MSVVVNVFVAVSCTILLQNSVTCQICTPVEYPAFIDRHVDFNGNPPVQVVHPSRFIIMSYLFGCTGTITKWELYTVNNGLHPIEFQVWRDDTRISRSLTLSLIGTNYYPDVQPDSSNLLSLPVPREQQIKVQPGDRLGITTFENNSTNDFRIQDYIFTGTVIFYEVQGSNPPTPNSLSFANHNARFSPIHFLPVMNVTVVPVAAAGVDESTNEGPSSGTSPLVTTLSGSSSLPQSTVIAIASSAAIVALLSMMLFVTIIICCCVMLKGVKGMPVKPQPTGQEQMVELDYNPAYHDGHHVNYEHDQQTEPYYSLVTEDQGGVSHTRDSYVEIQPNYAAAHTK